MPGKVKVKIIAGRNLPVMDRSSDTTDAYVEIKLGGTTYKTDVCRKSLHPQWNSEWYRFEVDDSELQDEPLQMRLMDHDTYSANDAIGKVYLNLNPLLLPSCVPMMKYGSNLDSNINSSKNSVLSGWIPVYDTMHGIRGEVNVTVKVELFSDFNKFRQSSCGVHFFYTPSIPHGYYAQAIYGFVEELIVSDDPEYKWIDKIRTPRASNEARQTLFFKLSGELQRKIGVKALELGANSVVGYRQCFDLEGEYGIVARGIGTAAFLVKIAQTAENEEHYQTYLNPPCSEKSFCLKVEPFNNKYLFPFNNTKNSLTLLKMNQSKSFDQSSVISKPITLVKGSSLKSLLDQEDNRYSHGIGFSQKVRSFKYNFIRDKDPVSRNRNFPSIPKRKFFAKKSERTSVMAEMLARSVLDCHSNLAPVIEHQDSGASDKSVSEKHSSSLSLPESVSIDEKSGFTLNNAEESVDFSTQDSMSSESSSSDDVSNNNEVVNTVDDTISDIVRNLELPKKTKYLVRQHSLSLNDLSSEYGSSLFSVLSRGPNEGKSCHSNLNILDKFSKNDISIYSRFTNKNTILSRSDNLLCFEKRELFPPKASSNLEIRFVREKENEDEVSAKSELLKYPKQLDVLKHSSMLDNVSGDDSKSCAKVSADSFCHGYRNEDPKIILPPIEIKGDIEKQSLVKTAMQTILLEKANIIGSYTPPVSPSVRVDDTGPSDLKLEPSEKCFSFPNVDPPNEPRKLKRREEQETVLGIHFQSISTSALSKYSNKRSFLSDRVLNKPITDFEKLKYKVSKTKSCFPNIVHVDAKKYSRKNSLIQRLQYSGMKRMSLFSKKSSNTLKQQRSFSSDDITPKNTLNKSHYLPKMLSRLSLFKQKEKKKVRSQSVFYTNDIVPSCEAGTECDVETELILLEGTSPLPTSPVSELIPNIMPEDDSPPIFNSECCNIPNNKHASSALSTRCNPPPLPDSFQADHHRSESMGTKMSHSPAKLANIASIHRRSSDSDLSVTPKGNSLTGNDRSGGVNHALKPGMILRSVVHQDSFDMLEYPFLTISKYPPGFILHLGGAVSARSVKLLERISNIEEPETRDSWWAELRMEMRSHAKALNCNAVLGYTEICSICEDVCVLSAYGTAAIIGSPRCNEVFENTPSGLNKDLLHDKSESDRDRLAQKDSHSKSQTESEQENTLRYPNTSSCMICHLPYTASLQFRSTALKCCLCRVGKVPEVLITTIDATDGIPILGRGCLVQASVQRTLKDLKGEYNAKQISDGLPFLEYELHRILASKLKIKGMNAIFNLKIRISIGEKMLIGVATGTAMFLTPLQSLTLPKLISDKTGDEKKLADLKKRLKDTVKRNKKIYQIKTEDIQAAQMTVDEELEEEGASLELTLGSKECCLLEVDDPDDAAVIQNLLIEVSPPKGIHLVNTEMVPGLGEMEIVKNLQMFKRIYRSKIHQSCNLNQHFQKLLQSIYFKLRKMVPCAVCDLQFGVDLPEGDEVQICVLGMALGLADSQKLKLKRKNTAAKHDDLIFNLEEVNIPENSTVDTLSNAATDASPINKKVKSPARVKAQSLNQQHIPYRERYGVDITPLTYIPGGKIEKYLGNLNLFLVRETTSIREEGGPSGFIHSFATEVLAIVRAHVTALGGNGMVSYFLTECVLNYNLHKNQGQCLINVGGDVVFVSYFKEE